jgi:Mrp family chromosome partitioning ATPase
VLAALAAPVAIDMSDRRIRTVSDAERTLGLPALGWLVERNGLITEMLAEDQLRRLAAGLLRERARHGAAVFGLCGVKPGAGASGITLKLANALTGMGFATLAVEANAFSCDARYGNSGPGLAQCLDASASASECIVPADDKLPARIRVGSGERQRHLGNLARLDVLLEEWSRDYAFVLVDMPPLLLSADAEILINRLGQSLLIVEANAINKGELARAARMLESTTAKAIGIIVSRIAVLEGSGYLHEMMIEQATGKKFSDFQTLPVWKLKLQMMVPLSVYLMTERIATRIEQWRQRGNRRKEQK